MNIKYFLVDFWGNIRYAWPDNIKRFWHFRKALWNDWNFDFHGMYGILKVKLELLEGCLRNGLSIDGKEQADEIVKVIEALDRLSNDEYDLESHRAIEEKWGKAAFDFVPLESGNFKMVDGRDNTLSDEEREQKRKETRAGYKEAQRKRTEDIALVFNTIRDKHQSWWD